MEERPNYVEDAVSIAVASQLALLSFPFFRHTVVPISRAKERWLGADARLFSGKRFLPFYMQFKRPFAHVYTSRARIISDRSKLSPPLSIAPRILNFSLQRKQQHHRDFQHNVLYRLRQRLLKRGLGDAAYVCPLFLDRQTYFFNSHFAGLRRWLRYWPSRAYDRHDLRIALASGGLVTIRDLPLLAEHVSIPPHAPVTSSEHKYSFTEKGTEVCFHSPEYLPEGGMVFSEWLASLVSSVEDGRDLVSLSDGYADLREIVAEALNEEADELLSPSSAAQAWFVWGEYLEKNYGIEQYGVFFDNA
jgi:hypothetical protein